MTTLSAALNLDKKIADKNLRLNKDKINERQGQSFNGLKHPVDETWWGLIR